MTRFARAKGSKSSNLKSPEDGTPWEVMKEQLLKSKSQSEENKNREKAEKQRIENYNNFLKDQKTQKRKATWCEFPEAQTNNKNNKNKKKKPNSLNSLSNFQENTQNPADDLGDDEKKINKLLKKKNKKKKSTNFEQNSESLCEEINLQQPVVSHKQNPNENNQIHQLGEKKKKNKKKKEKQPQEVKVNIESDVSLNNSAPLVDETKDSNNTENKKKRKNKKQKMSEQLTNGESNKSTINEQKANIGKQPAPSKKQKNKSGRRKPIDDKSFQLIINDKEVHLIRFDGFPVMKKDADRLQELKKSMIQKGIPKSEVQRTMKLERRRAEKALARLKREVCYNCRKGGHNLSDCPDLKSNIPGAGTADGVCFKCGSTEHRQFECKVQRDKEFRFATCFICKEAGHIARQCPDNPKGLYPNGGCCKLCGDVTHLRKDCPTVKEQKEGNSIKLQTLNDNNIEDIGQSVKQVTEEIAKKPKKIKF